MAKQAKSVLLEKRKKRWFSVLAPPVLNEKPLPDIVAFEPDELVGRKVEVSLKEFTANYKDSLKKVVCRIVKVHGDTAHTEAEKYFVTDSYIQRTEKKYPSRVMSVQRVKSKDEKSIKVKACALICHKVNRSVRAKIQRFFVESINSAVSKTPSQELFTPKFLGSVFAEKSGINRIYPVDKLFIWKMSIE